MKNSEAQRYSWELRRSSPTLESGVPAPCSPYSSFLQAINLVILMYWFLAKQTVVDYTDRLKDLNTGELKNSECRRNTGDRGLGRERESEIERERGREGERERERERERGREGGRSEGERGERE